MEAKAGEKTVCLKGIAASPGIAIGEAVLFDSGPAPIEKYHIDATQVDREGKRLDEAVVDSLLQIQTLQEKFGQRVKGPAFSILEAQALIVKDDLLLEGAKALIDQHHINAEWALFKHGERIKELFDELEEELFKERHSDVDSACQRIIKNLMGKFTEVPHDLDEKSMVVAPSLGPGDPLLLHHLKVQGFATDMGSRTSHTSILARSLEIPAVVGVKDLSDTVGSGDVIIVDGNTGSVIVHPCDAQIAEYSARRDQDASLARVVLGNRAQEARTQDGHLLSLLANIDIAEETDAVSHYGGEGVGLLRTEYLFIEAHHLPDENEQYQSYRSIVEKIAPGPVIIRTLDIGGDKLAENTRAALDLLPFFSLRAIRHCLQEKHLFKTQIRAVLRASAHGDVRLLVPFISCLTEVNQVIEIVEEVKQELQASGQPYNADIPLGIMIELPSAALAADHLAEKVDFFSIGTNDLIQYTFAIQRDQDKTSYLYQPLHPALLRLLKFVAEAGHAAGIPVGVCGEVAGEPLYTLPLISLGFSSLSMSPRSIPRVKQIIRKATLSQAQNLFDEMTQLKTVKDVNDLVVSEMHKLMPGAFEYQDKK